MSKATDRIKEMRKQNNMKNNNTKGNKIEKLIEKRDFYNVYYSNPTIGEVKAKIMEHKINGTIYKAKNHDAAFKYLHDWKYSVDIIATYDGVSYTGKNKYDSKITAMCIKDIYMIVRETGECIWVDHAWLDERLATVAVGIYSNMYKNNKGGEVFINRLKAMKYAANYRKDGGYKTRYQISSENKKTRAEYVQEIQRQEGMHMTVNEIRAML
jgi:hypothetical protein